MEIKDIRRNVIIALFSDDFLMQKLVLKGGNALDIVHKIGDRSSLDVDFSIPDDFGNIDEVGGRLERTLVNRFDSLGYRVFDTSFTPKPSNTFGQKWGGYRMEFKLIHKKKAETYNLDKMRREAESIGDGQQRRTFSIEISKHEWCEDKLEANIDDYMVFAYTPRMIAIEKLRAICQQMKEYALRLHPSARARDFYDIHSIVTSGGADLFSAESLLLVRDVFAAKEVPLYLLSRVGAYKAHHEPDWPSVQVSVRRNVGDFSGYFDFVVKLADQLVEKLQANGHI